MAQTAAITSSIERALCALYVVGGDGERNGEIEFGKQMLLMQPEGLTLSNPREASALVLLAFSNPQESATFRESVMKKGWNANTELKAMANPLVKVQLSASLKKDMHRREMEKGEETQRAVCIMKSLYIPVKSFQICEDNMRLCDSALASVQKIKDLSDAARFLETYGSHVSQSVYHLGGVLYEQMTFTSAQSTSLTDLLEEGARVMEGSVSAGSYGVSGGIEGSKNICELHKTNNKRTSDFKVSVKQVLALGPTNVKDETEFRSKLGEGPSSWSIIDKSRDTVEDLVAVWKILLQQRRYVKSDSAKKTLETAAVLLYNAWLNKARSSKRAYSQLVTALIECEERTYYKFQDQLQLPHDDELEDVSPLPHALTWVFPGVELPQKLQTVLADQSTVDLSVNVSTILRSCIAHLSTTHGGESLLRKIVNVIINYGFKQCGEAEYPMNDEHLRSMIDDLNGLNGTDENSIDPQHPSNIAWDKFSLSLPIISSPHTSTAFRYVGDVLVDKPITEQMQTHRNQLILIDRLRHSLDPFPKQTLENKPNLRKKNSSLANKRPEAQPEAGSCVFDDLLQVMRESDLPAQVAMCRFLLEAWAAIPLVVRMPAALTRTKEPPFSFTHWVLALSFVEVKLPQERCCYIAEDLALPRVVFVSDMEVQKSRAARVASKILGCNFPSQHMNRQRLMSGVKSFTPAVQVGVGFLDSKPCLALHVEGPYYELRGFVTAIADVIVLEQANGVVCRLNCEGKPLLRWNMDVEDGHAEDFSEIWGTEGYLENMIRHILTSELMDDEVQADCARRKNLKELCSSHFYPSSLISFKCMVEILEKCDFTKVRESLCLQDSFAKEASHFFALLRLQNNPGERCIVEKACENERKTRSQQSISVAKVPLLQVFRTVLSQRDATKRWVGLMGLQRYIAENAPHAGKDLGIVNLWRELCHIFVAHPSSQRELAKLAAQHLLDGFPLEILDGDASMFCQPWVDTVMSELEILTTKALGKAAKLFVFSAMGLQSSGKSTILNIMFGAQLMASAGRCTRGVFMQLVPSKRPEYDYVLVLDTEGLRSSDFHGRELAEVHDNRLAAFGLLPADASIFMISVEDDNGLKEVLPMVLLGFKGSLIAEESGGKIRAKMFFVYRSVNMSDKGKLNANKAKLGRHLADASKEVSSMGRTGSGAADDERLLQNMFQDFHVDEDEQKSDVRCMGNLKAGSKPPKDVPDWEYGRHVMELREHINRRLLGGGQWAPVGLREWTENLARVWTCICKADFDLSFKTAVECSAYAELQEVLTSGPRRMVNMQFMVEFERLEKKLREIANSDSSANNARRPMTNDLFTALQKGVQSVVTTQSKVVEDKILGNRRWLKWKHQEETNWKMFCKNLEESYKGRIKDMCDGVFEYDAAARRYEMQMKKEIVEIFQKGGLPQYESNERKVAARDKLFNGIFERILSQAAQSHPPLADGVPKKVVEAYQRTKIAAEVDLSPLRPEKFVQAVRNKASSIMHRPQPRVLQKKLQGCIDLSLRDTRQYSEVIAESVLMETDRMIKNAGCSRDLRDELHTFVKSRLSDAFQKIQTVWDEEHNIKAKLSRAKVRLRAFFENCANGIGAASMLISELEHLLQDELVERHHDVLVRFVSDNLSGHAVIRDWKKLRACLDLHLLILINNRSSQSTAQLLTFVANGSLHYRAITDILIGVQIENNYKQQQQIYSGIVLRSLQDAANSDRNDLPTHKGHPRTVEFFLNKLKEALEASLQNYEINSSCLPLGQCINSRISRDAYEGGLSCLDSEFYKTGVKGLCERLRSLDYWQGGVLKRDLIDRVRKRMQAGNSDLGPRCPAMCPMCGILCINAVGHTSKHDTVHQVCGLRGVWHDDTHELWKWSCYDDIVKENRFKHKDTWYPAEDFEKVFPDWVNPTALSADASRSLQVREYIFYNYQHALIAKYPNYKPCSDIPTSYNHDFHMLQNRVQDVLQGNHNELKRLFTESL